jgi:hypothetical protein
MCSFYFLFAFVYFMYADLRRASGVHCRLQQCKSERVSL